MVSPQIQTRTSDPIPLAPGAKQQIIGNFQASSRSIKKGLFDLPEIDILGTIVHRP
jgi:hypothetical protein